MSAEFGKKYSDLDLEWMIGRPASGPFTDLLKQLVEARLVIREASRVGQPEFLKDLATEFLAKHDKKNDKT